MDSIFDKAWSDRFMKDLNSQYDPKFFAYRATVTEKDKEILMVNKIGTDLANSVFDDGKDK